MPRSQVRISLLVVALIGLVGVAVAFALRSPAAPFAGMPPQPAAHWSWVAAAQTGSQTAVEDGLALVHRQPEFGWTYLRLADLCRETGRGAACRANLEAESPQEADARAYRAAALAVLTDGSAARQAAWEALAREPRLDLPIVRRLVEAARADGWSDRLTAAWTRPGSATGPAPAFGLALLASAGGDLNRTDSLLAVARSQAPDAPEVYRELGRLHFARGDASAMTTVLREGLKVAQARYDAEAALVLRGNLALALLEQVGDLDGADRAFREALAESRLLGDRRREAFNQYRLGLVASRRQHFDTAIAYADSAARLFAERQDPAEAEAHVLKAFSAQALARFSDADVSLQQARQVRTADATTQVQIHLAQAQLWRQMGRFDDARRLALDVKQTAAASAIVPAQIGALSVLAEIEQMSGNFEQARTHLTNALHLAEQGRLVDRARVLYAALGRLALDLQDPLGARQMLERAADGSAEQYEALGRMYAQYGNLPEAVRYYDRALAARTAGTDRHRLVVNKARALLDMGRVEEADALVQPLAQEGSKEAGWAAYAWMIRARAAMAQAKPRVALAMLDRAQASLKATPNVSGAWEVEAVRAEAYRSMGRSGDAERAYRAAIATIEALRTNLYTIQQRATFARDKQEVYDGLASLLHRQGRLDEAFLVQEQARGRSLSDLILTSQQGTKGGASTTRLLEAQRRREAIARMLDETADESGADRTRSATLQREWERTEALYAEASASMLSERRFALLAQPRSLREVQAVLNPGEAMVVYSVGEQVSSALVVTRERTLSVALPFGTTESADVVTFFRDALRGTATPWQGASRRLYRELLAPVMTSLPAGTTHLHLVPQGVLHYLPFAALQDDTGRFLVERVTLSEVPSASVLVTSREKSRAIGARWRRILALGDPTGRLPGARNEVQQMAALPQVRTDALIGDRATKANLNALIGEADILHFATHGRFAARSPWASSLELRDGELAVGDIVNLRLDRPYLVTLSACETAVGSGTASDLPAGDEWVSLNQAFLVAGAPSVLATQWAVDDRASTPLVGAFYRHLLEDRGKAFALATAQRETIRSARRHPFYWAAYTLTGDPL